MIYYLGTACIAIVFFVSICYWAVNFFVKQNTERAYTRFQQRVAREAELAIKMFREALCEQIVLQENKSDSLAKLYATLIDLLQLGKEFTVILGKKEMDAAYRKVENIKAMGEMFVGNYQKQSLHFSEELCTTLDAFVAELQQVLQFIESNWNLTQKVAADNERLEAAIRQNWLKFEDRITTVMEVLRTEFRRRQPSGGVMLQWLKDAGAPPPK